LYIISTCGREASARLLFSAVQKTGPCPDHRKRTPVTLSPPDRIIDVERRYLTVEMP